MNCRNCGMPLVGSRCEYCGTRYDILKAEVKPLNIYEPTMTKRETLETAKEAWTKDGIKFFCDDYGNVAVECGGFRWNERGIVWRC